MKELVRIAMLTLFCVSMVACIQAKDTGTNCHGNDILLEENYFPQSAGVSPQITPLPEGTINSSGYTIYLGLGIFVQNVFPFSTSRRAEAEFRAELRDPVFSKTSTWSLPTNLASLALKADDYRVACGIQNNIPMCRAILYHDRYFVYVNAHTYEHELTASDFVTAIQEIDTRIQSCIEGNR